MKLKVLFQDLRKNTGYEPCLFLVVKVSSQSLLRARRTYCVNSTPICDR